MVCRMTSLVDLMQPDCDQIAHGAAMNASMALWLFLFQPNRSNH